MKTLVLNDPQVLVLAEGDTPSAIANSRGHLFERFVARLLANFGFEEPRVENLNVTAEGIELDVAVNHQLTQQPAIVECKAYSAPVSAEKLDAFFGKLNVRRFRAAETHGFFFAIPRLTQPGLEQAKAIAQEDTKFSYYGAAGIVDVLKDLHLVSDAPSTTSLVSDSAVVITDHGIYSAHTELHPQTRLATSVAVWSADGSSVPAPVLALIAASDYAGGVSVHDATEPSAPKTPAPSADYDPIVVEVTGSSSDFEYQLPASPRYFVGRRRLVDTLEGVLDAGNGVLVLNAQSGWGKSSLALRLRQLVEKREGYALVVDSRTASSRHYATAVIRRAATEAQRRGLISLPPSHSYASLGSALQTLAHSEWRRSGAPLLVFFDQFENVFRDESLTREFRDLALGVREVAGPVIVGFAWKTDLVGWTEGHPYRLRDEIRANAQVVPVGPLGASEIDTLLRRLEKEVHESLVPDLRQRLREYSQGLPWLFKKLAGHLIREVQQGVTQARLVAEALNVQNLFEADLAELQPVEQEALRHVARYAPISVTEVMDRTPAAIVQSLLDRRLIVQVGERLDTYWDIFRDFLNTGRIPIEDSYILRQTPRSVARLLEEVVSDEGDSYVPDVARRWHTSENAIYNLSREVRLLGVVAYEPNHVRLAPEVWGAPDPEEELRHRVGVALRRHRAYSFLVRLWERSPSFVSIGLFAKELPAAFPAVEVTTNTWTAYARAFAMWFSYAGLAVLRGQILTPPAGDEHSDSLLLSGGRMPPRTRGAFPHSPPGPSIKLLREIARSGGKWNFSPGRSTSRPLRELLILGAIWIARDGTVRIVDQALLDDEYQLKPEELLRLLKMVPGAEAALRVLKENPAAAPMTVGLALAKATGATWAPGTTHSAGKYFRSWARTAGVPVRRPSRESVKADSEEHEVEPEEHELEPEEDESSPQLSFEGWRTFPP